MFFLQPFTVTSDSLFKATPLFLQQRDAPFTHFHKNYRMCQVNNYFTLISFKKTY